MEKEKEDKSFRDAISTVDEKGKRIWIFPKMPKGKYYNKRKLVSFLLLFFLVITPFLKINGNPVLMFNILERKFVLLGQIFWPQDFHIFAIAMVTGVLFVIVFTLIFGRLFCGWICPQTIFMEMVFRRIEYWIEGDMNHQKKLSKAPWNAEKIKKTALKHFLFWIISFFIANIFLAYIIGSDQLFKIVIDSPSNHTGGLIALFIFTTIFYLVFSKMREQVCTVVCPYGRLQGVLLDNRSLTVAYDYVRGESRAKLKKEEDRDASSKGDCIDCDQCVQVCPTGIDIRNGTQLECVNCTACMDACDFMMESIKKPPGLIRYDSIEGIENKSPFQFTARVKGYSAVLLILLGVLTFLLSSRKDFEATILRTRGTIFQEVEKGLFSNLYDINLVNKTNVEQNIEIRLLDHKGELKIIGRPLHIAAQGTSEGKFMILIKDSKISKSKTMLRLGVYNHENELIETTTISFIKPLL